MAFSSCSKDEEESAESRKAKKEAALKEELLGRWYQLDATLNGNKARLEMHLKSNGKGHIVLKSSDRTNMEVYYGEFYYTISGETITFTGDKTVNGSYTIKSSYSSGFTMVNNANSKESTLYKSDSDCELLKYLWKLKLTDSSIKNYYLFEFYVTGNGNAKYVKSSSTDYENISFTYTHDYANGPMTINLANGQSANFFYTVRIGIDLVCFSKDSKTGNTMYSLLTYQTK